MKRILAYDYKYKKLIADHLQRLLDSKYVEISDEEFERITTAVNTYLGSFDSSSNSSNEGEEKVLTKVLNDLEQLRLEIDTINPSTYDVDENGIFFVDEEGNIGAKITSSGLYAINLDENSSGGSTPGTLVAALNDLTDVNVTTPADGQALIYYSNSSSWKNSSVSGGGIGEELTIVDY